MRVIRKPLKSKGGTLGTPLPTEDKKGIAELTKLNLEIDLLRRERKFFWLKSPVITTLVAAAGLFLTAWQFQRTENAKIEERLIGFENQKQERKAKIHAEIRSDSAQLTEFEVDPKITATRARFLIDDLRALVARDELKDDRFHWEEKVAEDLRAIVWRLPFDQRRHFDFDVLTLNRWNTNRQFWHLNHSAHSDFLTAKYYPKIEELKPCFEKLVGLHANDYKLLPDTCDEELVAAINYGLEAHARVAQSTTALLELTEVFAKAANNKPLADKLKQRVESK